MVRGILPSVCHGLLARGGNILGAIALEDFLCSAGFVFVLRVHRNEDVPLLEQFLVTLGFVLGHSQTDQSARKPASGGADASSAEGCHNWTSRNKRPGARDSQRANACEPTERATEHSSGGGSSRRTFGCLRILLARKLLAGAFVRKQHGDIIL